jgi:hypothetical protein
VVPVSGCVDDRHVMPYPGMRDKGERESGGYHVSGKAWRTGLDWGHELTDVDLGTVGYSIGPLALGTWDETR